MSYVVPGMKLIPQTMKMSCWYASAQMLIHWRRERLQMTETAIMDPSEDMASAIMRDGDGGIGNPQIIAFAKRLGLVPVPPMSPTPAALENWLMNYGPLWTNGKTHIVVIAGIKPEKVLVYDPAPINLGNVDWRTLAGWYIGSSVSSRDTSDEVPAVFLHCPSLPGNQTAGPSRTYSVKAGDTLSKIAKQVYGDASKWTLIFETNKDKIKDPNVIFPGQVLVIPDK